MSSYLLLFFLALLLLELHIQPIQGKTGRIKCKENEKQALLKFKQGLEDNALLLTWREGESEDCCKWKGVQCNNQTGHVEMLHLHGSGSDYKMAGMNRLYLAGVISSSLSELQQLEFLDLSYNDFNGNQIPEFFGSFESLNYLNLSRAGFEGKIPHQLGMLSNLQYLDLSMNQLNGSIPYQLGMLSNLQHLILGGNLLDGVIPFQLGNLSQLLSLNLSENYLVGVIPCQLGNLSTLQILDLDDNNGLKFYEGNQTSSAEWLSNLSSLTDLDLSVVSNLNYSNHWIDLIGFLPRLRKLRLNSCGLSDSNLIALSSPSHLNFSSLFMLDLSYNRFTSSKIFQWVSNYSSNLHELDLYNNFLKDPIPDGFANMNSLKYLRLHDNNLEGEVPKCLGSICGLQLLSIYNNNLSGGLQSFMHNSSECIGRALQYLDLSENRITGILPNFSSFLTLKYVFLCDNQLYGEITKSIRSLASLEHLALRSNSFKGVITESHFTNLSRLNWLQLSYNSLALNFSADWVPSFQLQGLAVASCKLGPRFPKWLQTQKELLRLDISDAKIMDFVPNWFWVMSQNMLSMDISHNSFGGTIPNLPLSFNYRPEIALTSNEFEGSIPPFMLKASALYLSKNKFSDLDLFSCDKSGAELLGILDVSSNLLTGHLPNCWNHLKSLEFLDLSNNKLSGEIPTSFGTLIDLKALVLRNNSLVGDLPSALKNCTKLLMLDVGVNNLSGPIPSWIGESLQQMVVLSLQLNHFNGSLPLNLCYLRKIQVLDLSLNSLSEGIPPCLGNLTVMAQGSILSSEDYTSNHYYEFNGLPFSSYDFVLLLMWKGVESKFKNPELMLNSIDLSSNHLTGEIPRGIGDLLALRSLNLSRNNLSGQITSKFGNLESLEFLDLSRNHLSGKIPSTLAQIDRLTQLDVSNNYLCGKIPIGTQLQSFNASNYEENLCLCGEPLDQKCPEEETPPPQATSMFEHGDDNSEFLEAFYMSMGLGFFTGFWGFVGPILFNYSWRRAYSKFLNNIFKLCV